MTVRLLLILSVLVTVSPVRSSGYDFSYRAAEDGLAPLTVNFRAQVPAGAQVSWDFGDGRAAQGLNPTHTFYQPGTYRVSVRTQNGSTTATGQISITVRDAGPERAEITLLQRGGSFTASADASRVYAPFAPRWTLDGVPLDRASGPLRDGPHVLRLELNGRNGPLSREVRFRSGRVTGSVPFDLEVVRLTNEARARGWDCAAQRYGGPARAPLARNAALDTAALAQSAGMALNNYWGHQSAVDGSSAGDRARAAGYAWSRVAENIAGGQTSPQEVVQGWLRSPGHCKNIMSDHREIGVGYVSREGSELRTYWTQVFGTR